jgi:hypothetical protein
MNNEALTLPQEYVPATMTVPKDTFYAIASALISGIEYARDRLGAHDLALGRTTHKNKTYAELIEADIRHMEATLTDLKEIKVNP